MYPGKCFVAVVVGGVGASGCICLQGLICLIVVVARCFGFVVAVLVIAVAVLVSVGVAVGIVDVGMVGILVAGVRVMPQVMVSTPLICL